MPMDSAYFFGPLDDRQIIGFRARRALSGRKIFAQRMADELRMTSVFAAGRDGL